MEPKDYIRKIATHYHDSDSIKRILEFSSIDTINIDIEGKALNIWFLALKEAHHRGKLTELIQNATAEYPALKTTDEELDRLQNFLSDDPNRHPRLPDPPYPRYPDLRESYSPPKSKWIKLVIAILLLLIILFALKIFIPWPDPLKCEKKEVMKSLKGHVHVPIPNQVDPEQGNMKQPMLDYLDRYSISSNQELKQELNAIKQLVEHKSNPNNPAKYFTADNEFKSRLGHFKNKVQHYTKTCNWN